MMPNLRADLARYQRRPWQYGAWGVFRLLTGTFGLQATVVYRFGRWLVAARKRPLLWAILPIGWLVYGILAGVIRAGCDIHLHLSAEIGPGLYIGHFGGIRLSRCALGPYCSVGEQTRILGQVRQRVVLGTRVWVGSHTVICGPVSVGSGATISAGSEVTGDVPADALVMGRPTRVVQASYDNSALSGLQPVHPAS